MIKKHLNKIMVLGIICVSVLALNPIGVSAEWKLMQADQCDDLWWYSEGDSYATGWRLIDGNWYYFNNSGYMVTDKVIDGYHLNSSGVWIENPISRERAVEILAKARNVDYQYVSVLPYAEADKLLDGVQYYHIEVVSKGGRGAASTYYVNSRTGEIIGILDGERFDRINKIISYY